MIYAAMGKLTTFKFYWFKQNVHGDHDIINPKDQKNNYGGKINCSRPFIQSDMNIPIYKRFI